MNIEVKQSTVDAFKEMGVTNISDYLDSIANSHEMQKVNAELIAKPIEEKQNFLKAKEK